MYKITLPLILVAALGALLWKFLPVSRPAYQGMSSGISSDLQADTASKIWITAGLVSASGHRDEAGRGHMAAACQHHINYNTILPSASASRGGYHLPARQATATLHLNGTAFSWQLQSLVPTA